MIEPKIALTALRNEWKGCTRCGLSHLRRPEDLVVVGGGAFRPDYLVVYDAPEDADAETGVPLRGKHGQILEGLIKKADYAPNSFAFAPVVGCRPYTVLRAIDDQPEQIRDRDPSAEEVDACKSRIDAIIYITDPRLIFAVGTAAWKALVRPKDRNGHNTLPDAAGELTCTYITGKLRTLRYPVMPLLPPKQVIANPTSAEHGPIATTIEALIRAKTYVSMLKKDEV